MRKSNLCIVLILAIFIFSDLEQIMPKLLLLTIHFPKLRIIWSPGAHYTSEIFHVIFLSNSSRLFCHFNLFGSCYIVVYITLGAENRQSPA